MFIYGIDAEAAFAFMRRQPQQHNGKLRLLAERIVGDLTGVSTQQTPVTKRFPIYYCSPRIAHG